MAGSGTWSSASHPASSRKAAPQCPRTKTQAQHPRGSGGTFSFASHLRDEDFLTEGGTRGGVRSGPGRVERPLLRGTPRGADQGVAPPPFCGSQGVLGLRYALPPPRLGRPVAWREVSRKARIDVLTVAVTAYNGGPAGGGGGRTGRMPRAFFLRKPGTDPQKSEVIRGCRLRKPGSNRLAPFLLLYAIGYSRATRTLK